LLRLVEAGDLDLTFTELAVHDHTGFETRDLLEDPIVFAAPAESPEAELAVVAVDDIAHLPMIGIRNSDCQAFVLEAFGHLPEPPNFVFRSDDNPTIQGCIASGLAYAVLPLLTLDDHDPSVAIVPIDPQPTPRRLGVAWHADRRAPAALAPFVAAATTVCDEFDERWKAWRTARLAEAGRGRGRPRRSA
ncbi:MAG: LysR family transcriptional regulator substrate-binding protein, partial [Acidimicrobiales bacterium]